MNRTKNIDKMIKGKSFVAVLGDNFVPNEKQRYEFDLFMSKIKWESNFTYRLATFMKYDLDDYVGRFEKLRSVRSGQTEWRYKLLYGDAEGQIRWDQYCLKQGDSNSFEYKKAKFGWTREEYDSYNKSRAVTIDNLIERHGDEKGLEIWENYCEQQRYTNSLEYFVEREGSHDKGLATWLDYNHAKASSKRPEDLAIKRGISVEEAAQLISDISHVSEAEKKFVDKFEGFVGPIQYTHKTRQHFIGSYWFDITCLERKKLIEFHGDYWHANPQRYKADHYFKKRDMTAGFIWERDAKRINAAKEAGFDVRIIWELSVPYLDWNELVKWWNE